MPTGVINRSVIIEVFSYVNGSAIYHFTEIVVSFKQTVQALIIQILFYSPSALCLRLICTIFQIPLNEC